MCTPSAHMETLKQMVFCTIGFLQLEINLFFFGFLFFSFFFFFFCSYLIGFQICSGRTWVDSQPSGRRGKFFELLSDPQGEKEWLATLRVLMAWFLLIVARGSDFHHGLWSELRFVGEILYSLWIALSWQNWNPKGQKGVSKLGDRWRHCLRCPFKTKTPTRNMIWGPN